MFHLTSTRNKGKAISISLGLICTDQPSASAPLLGFFLSGFRNWCVRCPMPACLWCLVPTCPGCALMNWARWWRGPGRVSQPSCFLTHIMATVAVLFPSWERSFKHVLGDVRVAFLCVEWSVGLPRGTAAPSPGEDHQDFTTPGTSFSFPWSVLHVIWTLVSWRVGFPGGKEPPCQCKRHRRHRFYP